MRHPPIDVRCWMNRAFVIPAAMLMSVSFAAAEPPASIPLWPAGHRSEGKSSKEVVVINEAGEHRVSSIHSPSITPYLPAKIKPPARRSS